jgi:hypothetical protein
LLEYDRVTPQTHPAQEAAKGTQAAPKLSHWAIAASTALAVLGGAAAARYLLSTETSAPVSQVAQKANEEPSPAQPAPLAAAPAQAAPADDAAPAAADRESSAAEAPQEKGRRAVSRGANAPEDLLQKANQQRAAGEFRDAAQTYSVVYDRFPKSQAAYVARVAAASLELEHLSNPIKARKLFEQALTDRPRGALDLEARQGLSIALRDLEDRSGERQVLRMLISRHPGSPAARRAQVRLLELGGE